MINSYSLTIYEKPISNQCLYGLRKVKNIPIKFMKKEGKEFISKVRQKIIDCIPLQGRLRMEIVFYFKDALRRDIDNFTKIVIDSLNGYAFIDDSQIYELFLKKEIDGKNPRIEIKIIELRKGVRNQMSPLP